MPKNSVSVQTERGHTAWKFTISSVQSVMMKKSALYSLFHLYLYMYSVEYNAQTTVQSKVVLHYFPRLGKSRFFYRPSVFCSCFMFFVLSFKYLPRKKNI
jgi:hypothetical protein